MHRTLALFAIAATVGGATAATAGTAAADATPPAVEGPAPADRLLGLPILTNLLAGVTDLVGAQNALAGLTGGTDIAQLLDSATPTQADLLTQALSTTQLTTLLGALDTTQLTTLLAGLGAGDIGNLLQKASPAQLGELVGSLTGPQLAGALGTLTGGELGTLLSGLTGGDLDALLGDLDVPQLTGVLDILDQGQLTSLLGLLEGTALAPVVSGVKDALFPPAGGTGTGGTGGTGTGTSTGSGTGTGTGTGATTTTSTAKTPITVKPLTLAPRRPLAAPAAAFTGYRATITKISVARNRRSAKVTVACASTAPKGCLVTVTGKVAGRRAMTKKTVLLAPGERRTLTARLSAPAAKRLRTRGGALKVTVATVQSSLGSASRTAKVEAPTKK